MKGRHPPRWRPPWWSATARPSGRRFPPDPSLGRGACSSELVPVAGGTRPRARRRLASTAVLDSALARRPRPAREAPRCERAFRRIARDSALARRPCPGVAWAVRPRARRVLTRFRWKTSRIQGTLLSAPGISASQLRFFAPSRLKIFLDHQVLYSARVALLTLRGDVQARHEALSSSPGVVRDRAVSPNSASDASRRVGVVAPAGA